MTCATCGCWSEDAIKYWGCPGCLKDVEQKLEQARQDTKAIAKAERAGEAITGELMEFRCRKEKTVSDPKKHPLWNEFELFAKDNGISLKHEDDWRDWWDCFLFGAQAAMRVLAEAEKRPT